MRSFVSLVFINMILSCLILISSIYIHCKAIEEGLISDASFRLMVFGVLIFISTPSFWLAFIKEYILII